MNINYSTVAIEFNANPQYPYGKIKTLTFPKFRNSVKNTSSNCTFKASTVTHWVIVLVKTQ